MKRQPFSIYCEKFRLIDSSYPATPILLREAPIRVGVSRAEILALSQAIIGATKALHIRRQNNGNSCE